MRNVISYRLIRDPISDNCHSDNTHRDETTRKEEKKKKKEMKIRSLLGDIRNVDRETDRERADRANKIETNDRRKFREVSGDRNGIIKWFKEVGFKARGQSMNRERRPSKHAFLIIVIYTRGGIGLTSRWTRRSLVDYIPPYLPFPLRLSSLPFFSAQNGFATLNIFFSRNASNYPSE